MELKYYKLQFFLIFALLLHTVSASSCGYSLVGRGSSLPPEIKTARIPIFINKTNQPDLVKIVTDVVRLEFIKDGRLKIVDANYADSTIGGTIKHYSQKPISFDADNNVTAYTVRLVLAVQFTNDNNGKKLLSSSVEAKKRYDVDQSLLASETIRRAAITDAATKASESLISIIVEAF
ncbi:MAG TPA: LPS assembly lipoprotein LptE [Nitrospinota bacterium]|nr:LPS assembly lipoprotein LptE [Nitrospinota bacterium]|tara:strand:- start:226433 stop:226966 length:534 start_codon:yes stop_codon:yes gene_type:complete